MKKVQIPKTIRTKWLKALRSGKYKRGTGQLMRVHNGEQRYCCLGVLEHCVNGKVSRPNDPELSSRFLGSNDLLSFCDLLENDNGYVGVRSLTYQEYLAGLNDRSKKNFDYIADRIEKTSVGV